ncbi:hypothetical protein [Legionella worsleiensis]|uniref:Uncharacterized protein n=1 Tax=Legionella worsleiensis TaxID=45076 RepID=A0A0W1AG54_9GAMM|nr:hypothetical protein [Legionella worsleiensis]KTD80349.1 hypothetical protein Lwor_1020 [Legionella worsleiensis]STY32754.1 Uncharacterised protein [Legionella worsleiensis]
MYFKHNNKTNFCPPWPISKVRPNTFVHVNNEKNLLFAEYTADATAGINVGGCSIVLDFSEESQNPELLAAFVDYSGIQYVDNYKNFHACISANFFFSTKDLADKFVKSLPHEIHVYSNSTDYKQRHFWKNGIDVYLLAKTREEYIEILNKMFAFPEAKAHASQLFENHQLGLDRNVYSNDITSLNDSVAEFSENSTVVNSMAATSDSAPTTELISVFSGSKPDELVHPSPDEHLLPEASGDSDNSSEPISELIPEYHSLPEAPGDNDNSSEPISELIPEYNSKQSAVDVHGLRTVLGEGLLKNGIFSSEYSGKSNVNHAPHTQTETTVLVCDAFCQIL